MFKSEDNKKLLKAIEKEDLKRLKQVSKGGASIHIKKMFTSRQNKKLFEAIRNDDLEKLNQAIQNGANIDHIGKSHLSKKDMHSLSYAIECNSMACLEYLLDLGADYTIGEMAGESSVCLAGEKKNIKAMTLLVNAGANVNAKNKMGKTGLMLIIDSVAKLRHGQQGHRDKPELLEGVQAFIEAGAHLEVQDAMGRTALMQASFIGLSDVVKTLLDAHAKTELRDEDGNTALILTVMGDMSREDRLDCLDHLLAAKANVNAKNDNKETALYKSTYIPYPEVFRTLIEGFASTKNLTEREQEAYNVLYIEYTPVFTDEVLAPYAVANDHIVVKIDGERSLSQSFNFSKRTVTDIENGKVVSEKTFDEFKDNKRNILAAYKVMQETGCETKHPFPHMYLP